jgi:hypothetical protein
LRKLALLSLVLAVFASSCAFGDSPKGAADELAALAAKADEATYAAVYRFSFVQQFAPGQTTKLEIVQQPPTFVRRVETTTQPETGKPVSLSAWYIRNAEGAFACSEFADLGVRCQVKPIDAATFGSAKLNVYFDTPREPSAFSSVRKAARPVRIAGQQGTCYEAVPVSASPSPGSPEPSPDRFRYELCYAEDGILLRGKRTTLDDGDEAESFVQVTSVSRVVEPRELRLPGPVVDPGELQE